MRTIEGHNCEVAVAPLTIEADDKNETNRCSHKYTVRYHGPDSDVNPLIPFAELHFQEGALIPAGGWNGITEECLLAILIDRFESHMAGPYPNEHTRVALQYTRAALLECHQRKRERTARGVQGQHAK